MSPYRETPPTKPAPLLVLREEYEEAKGREFGLLVGAGFSSVLWAMFTAVLFSDTAALAVAPASFATGCAALFCLLWFWRTRRVIRRWRDQERERFAKAGEK